MGSNQGVQARRDTRGSAGNRVPSSSAMSDEAGFALSTRESAVERPPTALFETMDQLDSGAAFRITAENLSEAWLGVADALMQPGVHSIEPLVVTVNAFERDGRPQQFVGVASLIDDYLHEMHEAQVTKIGRLPKHGPLTVRTAASTIFPESLWNPSKSRHELYSMYLKLLPKLKRDPRNRRGIYFERLIAYGRGPEKMNQIEHMLRAFKKGVKRTSAYQASVVDPATDMTMTPLLGFPCLQQIALHPSERTGTLAITGFYGTQYVFERGYGNYLGLCRLGRFLAHEMGLRLTRMTCIASYAPVEGVGKARGRALVAAAKQVTAEQRRESCVSNET